jgi:hypothetical protein
VTAKIAGMESTAKIKSVLSTINKTQEEWRCHELSQAVNKNRSPS